MTITLTETEAHVAKGIALLDTEEPGWREMADADTLDLSDVTHCILAQVYGGWCSGLTALWPDHTYREQVTLATAHGFETDEDGYGDLTEAWRAALTGEQS